MAYDSELKLAKEAARAAGKIILEIYHQDYHVEMKSNETPVTKADLEANAVIVAMIHAHFPHDAILSEESSDNLDRLSQKRCWIIDPLDGTKEFIKKNDEFAVNIALAYENQIVMGVVYAPVFNELYFATEGGGAFVETLDPLTGELLCKPTHVSQRQESLKVLKSRSHENPRYAAILKTHEDRILKTKNVGSSYKGCLIAKGDYDIYYSFGTTSVWDVAPLEVILTQSGGFMAQGDGSPFRYNVETTSNSLGFMMLNSASNRLTDYKAGFIASFEEPFSEDDEA